MKKIKFFFQHITSRALPLLQKRKLFFEKTKGFLQFLYSKIKVFFYRIAHPTLSKTAFMLNKLRIFLRPIARFAYKALRRVSFFFVRSFQELRYQFLCAHTVRKNSNFLQGFFYFWVLSCRCAAIHRRFLRHIFNYLIIIAFVPVMLLLVNYYGTMTVALKLNVNGTEIGYIEEAAVYEEAYSMLQSRIIRTDDEQGKICVPIYSVAFVSMQELMNSGEVCESLLRSTHDNVEYAYGLYSASDLIGVLKKREDIEEILDTYIATFKGMYNDCEVSFADAISIEAGYYPGDYITTQAELTSYISKTFLAQMDYVAKEGDTYQSIAELFAMPTDRLFELNNLDPENLPVTYTQQGEKQVGVIHSGDVFRVEYTKYVLDVKLSYTNEYTVTKEYNTIRVADPAHYIGYSYVQQEGITGSTFETTKISYVYGIETERVVLNSTVITEKQDEILVVGTRASAALKESSEFYSAKYYWPVQKVRESFISAYYGDGRNHLGIDIAAPKNTEIYAGDTGVVSAVGFEENGYGWYVRITHSDGYQTFYAHCNEVLVKLGDSVSRGDLIAYVGTTGFSTGYHLHFEVRFGRDRLDPYPYLGLTGYGSSIPPSISTETEPPEQLPEEDPSSDITSSAPPSSSVPESSSPSSSEGATSSDIVGSQPPVSSDPKDETVSSVNSE